MSFHSSARLDPPEFINPPLTQFDIVEGQPSTINQSAKGNPATITYKWKRADDNEIGGAPRIAIDGPMLNISRAMRADSGVYKLFATNELGTSETSVRINVQCKFTSTALPNTFSLMIFFPHSDPPVITKTTQLVLVEEFSNANLECYVDSNPVNERVVTWQRRRNDTADIVGNGVGGGVADDEESFYSRMRSDVEILSSETQPFANGAKLKSSLLLVNATLQDSGTSFDCIANNGVGEAKATLTLLVLREYIFLPSADLIKTTCLRMRERCQAGRSRQRQENEKKINST